MSNATVDYDAFVSRLDNVKGAGKQRTAHCPAHDDHENSLSVGVKESGEPLFHCFAGCRFEEILAALDLKPGDLRPQQNGRARVNKKHNGERGEPAAIYRYEDAAGNLVCEKLRYRPKSFSWRRPDGNGSWIFNIKGITRPLYNLPALIRAIAADEIIFLPEGEGDTDMLVSHGLAATTNGGATDPWRPEFTEILSGARVAILGDNDPPGEKRTKRIWRRLAPKTTCAVVSLPDLPDKKGADVSDWLANGGRPEQLVKLAEAALANPPELPNKEGETLDAISNFIVIDDGDDDMKSSHALVNRKIEKNVLELSGDWPRRVGDLLFVDIGGDIWFLPQPEDLFAWMGTVAPIRWRATGIADNGVSFCPKGEFTAHMRYAARKYDQVESFPHHPEIEDVYYSWRAPDNYSPDGTHLDKLLGFFDNTESADDAALIRAMFLTVCWGGLAGTRPAFVIDAPDRGCGKSTIADAVGELVGAVSVEPGGRDEERIVSRLLSPLSLLSRVVSVDNIKGSMSSALVESLITSTRISGHRLYAGEAQRPNLLTWILTGNALRLSRDLADRAFIIRLKKPEPRPQWREDLFTFIRSNREKIIADIVEELKKKPYRRGASDRWQAWVDEVLSRCTDDPAAIVATNQKRRNDFDEDLEESQIIIDAVRQHLAAPHEESEPREGATIIAAAKMTEIINAALNLNLSDRKIANILKGHMAGGRLPQLKKDRSMYGRIYQVTL